ncbi:MAG TPA: TonB-dependent receptor [Candidatus Polarisedimenticolia bacterium]|jgi:outer membrane receptor protein involved in Fe transport|nr:TonB-dependent receptor [Candidatus Polarisedimenticolia bacterium]
MLARDLLASAALAALAFPALADEPPPPAPGTEYVEVTATRIPEEPDKVPAAVTVITGKDLRNRGATDIRSALALVAGVSIAPGGDGGPGAAVPEIWGLREFDAFLLVVDGVPQGGAFAPDLAMISLEDVERIEVHRGAAPVMYGATSFVGVIQIIRRSPGSGEAEAGVAGGNHSSGGISAAVDLPSWAGFSSRIAADYEKRGFEDPRTEFLRGHLLWRNQKAMGSGTKFRMDLEAAWVDQDPASPVPREGAVLSPNVPLDSNHNPGGATMEPRRETLTLGHSTPFASGTWDSTVSFTLRDERVLRGFLTDTSGASPDAVGFREEIDQTEAYLDTHWSLLTQSSLEVITGFDYLLGRVNAHGGDFNYFVPLDGSNPPDGDSLPSQSEVHIGDDRDFLGLYAYASWRAAPRWRLDGGLRWNYTLESRRASALEFATSTSTSGDDRRTESRPSGSIGAVFTAWEKGGDHVNLFAAYRDTFKPAVVDLGLDAESEILEPEAAQSWELGVKTRTLHGRLDVRLSAFTMDFRNLVVSQDVGGLPALVNAGNQRYRGADLEIEARLHEQWWGRLGYGRHSAKFLDYVQDFGGVPTQLRGNRQEMSPEDLASAGVVWARPKGLTAHVELEYVGDRFLNKRNTALADSYQTWSAGVGWRSKLWEFRLEGLNLNDTRPPVSESELADAQYYLMPGRRYFFSVQRSF